VSTRQVASPASLIPDWVVQEMPPGYQTRFAEIQRLSSEIHAMDRMGRLLWETGPALGEAAGDALAAMKYEVEQITAGDATALVVKLDTKRRLLVHVAEGTGLIEKKSAELAHAFTLLHELAGDHDRVVLVANGEAATPPKDRSASITADALQLLGRMGANFLESSALFKVWTTSVQDPNRAKSLIDQLHAQDGGAFKLL
jgi:hypothetical protein